MKGTVEAVTAGISLYTRVQKDEGKLVNRVASIRFEAA